MIYIEIDDRAVLDALNDLRARASDLRPAMKNVAQALESETELRFEREGPGWPALSERTILGRMKSGYGRGKMLQRSGQLAASVQTEYGRDYAQIGSNKAYAAIHQFGGQAGRGKKVTIPPRPYLPVDADGQLTETARETIMEKIKAFLER